MRTVTAFALIFDNRRRLLLCRRKKDCKWNLPGGHLAAGESPWQAVVREVREEIALRVQVLRLLGVYTVPKDDELIFTFVCAARSSRMRAGDDVDALDWFDLDHLPRNMREFHGVRARDALIAEAVVMRTQTRRPMSGSQRRQRRRSTHH